MEPEPINIAPRRGARPASLNDILDSVPFSSRLFTVSTLLVLTYAFCTAELMGVIYLSYALQCPWQQPGFIGGYLIISTHVGMLVGPIAWGVLADSFGRQRTLIVASCFLSFLLVLSAFCPNFVWTVFLRGLIGVAVGGVSVISAVMIVETFAARFRAKVLNGALVMACVADSLLLLLWYIVQPLLGWSAVTLLSAVPGLLIIPGIIWLSESPRFLLLVGQPMETMVAVQFLFGSRSSPLTSRRLADSLTCSRANLRCFLRRELRRVSLLLLLIWICAMFAGHGGVRLALLLPWLPHNCVLGPKPKYVIEMKEDESCCLPFNEATYASAMPRSLGPLLALLLNFVMLDGIGRRWTMAVWAGVGAATLLFLSLCLPPGLRHVLIFFLSGAVFAFSAALILFTAEIFPTCIRGTGLGICQAAGSFGVLIAGIIEVEFLPIRTVVILAVFSVAFIISLATAFFLRPETRNMALEQAIDGTIQPGSPPQPMPVTSAGYKTFELQPSP